MCVRTRTGIMTHRIYTAGVGAVSVLRIRWKCVVCIGKETWVYIRPLPPVLLTKVIPNVNTRGRTRHAAVQKPRVLPTELAG